MYILGVIINDIPAVSPLVAAALPIDSGPNEVKRHHLISVTYHHRTFFKRLIINRTKEKSKYSKNI